MIASRIPITQMQLAVMICCLPTTRGRKLHFAQRLFQVHRKSSSLALRGLVGSRIRIIIIFTTIFTIYAKNVCCTWVSKRIFHDFQKAISSSPPKFYTQHFSTRSHFACANDGCPFGPFFLRHRWEWPENLQIQSFSWKLMDLRTTNLER